jgi:F-type H+-transporting ATPase subunit epsilon
MFNVLILTSQDTFYKAEAVGVVAPGKEGYLEILTNHAPLITLLKEGQLVVFNPNKEEHSYRITGGFLEVHQNQVTVLVDEIEVLKGPHIVLAGLT